MQVISFLHKRYESEVRSRFEIMKIKRVTPGILRCKRPSLKVLYKLFLLQKTIYADLLIYFVIGSIWFPLAIGEQKKKLKRYSLN